MSKVKGPLFSFEARGTFGKTITYQNRPSGSACIRKSNPKDVKTSGEQRSRIISQLGRSKWRFLTASQKEAWEDEVKGKSRAGYHEFISQWLSRYLNDLIPFILPEKSLFWPQRIIIASKF